MTARNQVIVAVAAMLLVAFVSFPIPSYADECAPWFIDTVAGGGVGDHGPAVDAFLFFPQGVAASPEGSVYIADSRNHRVRKVDPAGIITTVAGDGWVDWYGHGGCAGDGGPATEASLNLPTSVALAVDGSLYIADTWNNRIRRVDSSGTIATVAGNGEWGYGGDGGPATEASLSRASGVAVAADGTLYIADTGNHRVRRVGPSGIITTVAGDGWTGGYGHGRYAGDGGPATQASLNHPHGLALGADGSIYIADYWNDRVRRVDPIGVITTVAGGGRPLGGIGDGGLATEAELAGPSDVALDADGTMYITSREIHRIRKVDPAGIITTVAGSGDWRDEYPGDYAGDGGPATEACLNYPESIAVAAGGILYVADTENHRIRKVDPAGIITTVAGNGQRGYSGDGGRATEAALRAPADVALAPDGSLYIADAYRVRKVDPAGIITTVAGNGQRGYSGDGGPAIEARLTASGVALGADGSLYIADGDYRIRKVDPAGIITSVAGRGECWGELGDGGPAIDASLCFPTGVAVGADGSLYIADQHHHRIRKVDPAGIVTTVAGDWRYGSGLDGRFAGDGGPATLAGLNYPNAVALGADGSLYIADSRNHRVRKVDPAGIITTVAGTGDPRGDLGDGGPATQASLAAPQGVAVGGDGSIYIADCWHQRIRRVDPMGIITTIAGSASRTDDDLGDRGPATEACLDYPTGVGAGADGTVYVAGDGHYRIRKVWPGPCCAPEYEPATVRVGDVVTLHANASAGIGEVLTCEWDFSDGTHASGCDTSHVFGSPGRYDACVTVTDDQGASHTCCTSVDVTCQCDVGVVGAWCHIPGGQVGQAKQGRIGARNAGAQACAVRLRVSNETGAVVFERVVTLPPLRSTRVSFGHTFAPEDVGRSLWTWEVQPVECDERTPRDNVFERRVVVVNSPGR